jgi:hypothetical protein
MGQHDTSNHGARDPKLTASIHDVRGGAGGVFVENVRPSSAGDVATTLNSVRSASRRTDRRSRRSRQLSLTDATAAQVSE